MNTEDMTEKLKALCIKYGWNTPFGLMLNCKNMTKSDFELFHKEVADLNKEERLNE